MVDMPKSKPANDTRYDDNSISGFGALADKLFEDVKE